MEPLQSREVPVHAPLSCVQRVHVRRVRTLRTLIDTQLERWQHAPGGVTARRCVDAAKTLYMFELALLREEWHVAWHMLAYDDLFTSPAVLRRCFHGAVAASARAEAEILMAQWRVLVPPPIEDVPPQSS